MKNLKRYLTAAFALAASAASGMASATATSMGQLINDNVDVGSISSTGSAIAGSAIGLAALIAAARVGKRLIRAL